MMSDVLCTAGYGGGGIVAFKRAGRPIAAAASLEKKQQFKKGEWKDHEKDPDAGDLHSKPDVVTSHKENGNVADAESLDKVPVEVEAEVKATDTDCESLPDIGDGQIPEIESDTTSVDNRVSEVVEDEVVEQKIAKEESAAPIMDSRDDTDGASMKPSEEIKIKLTTPASVPSREVVMTGLTLSVDRSNSAVEQTSSPTTPVSSLLICIMICIDLSSIFASLC